MRLRSELVGQCRSLAHLDVDNNEIGDDGAGQLVVVHGQCESLAHLELDIFGIRAEGVRRLRESVPPGLSMLIDGL